HGGRPLPVVTACVLPVARAPERLSHARRTKPRVRRRPRDGPVRGVPDAPRPYAGCWRPSGCHPRAAKPGDQIAVAVETAVARIPVAHLCVAATAEAFGQP